MKTRQGYAVFDLEKYETDPLELVKERRNKIIVRHLRSNKINGLELKKILDNMHGFHWVNPLTAFSPSRAMLKENRQIDYARRHCLALINSKVISDIEREELYKIDRRLSSDYIPLKRDKSGKLVLNITRAGNRAKSEKQMIGRQVIAMHSYIKKFNTKPFLQKEIFGLIAEILWVRYEIKFTVPQITNLERNNPRFSIRRFQPFLSGGVGSWQRSNE